MMISKTNPNAASLDVVNLTALMRITAGTREVAIGLIDGPVTVDHPELTSENIRTILPIQSVAPGADDAARAHGNFVAGVLSARRESSAPALCPGCTVLVRPIFLDAALGGCATPSATPDELADAVVESIDAGVRILNLSVALARLSSNTEQKVEEALNYAASRGVIIVAAAGNQGSIGSSTITRHPWVIPVAACDFLGRPMSLSNLSSSIGRRGLSAPGDAITSLGTNNEPITLGGTSAATPLVTGAVALLWSVFPAATPVQVRAAVTGLRTPQRKSIVPPVLDAWAAYRLMAERPATGQYEQRSGTLDNPTWERAPTLPGALARLHQERRTRLW